MKPTASAERIEKMEAISREIGRKIRTLRLSRHMTQAQLAGDSITRNMLSLIENGVAAPSLGTLVQIAQRLEVPVGYFFASDDEETSQFLKISLIGEIRALYDAGKYSDCLQKCAMLTRPDDEIRMITADAYLALTREACMSGSLLSASEYLEKASDAVRRCVYHADDIRSTAEYVSLMIHSVHMPQIPPELGTPAAFAASRVPAEMFVYVSALRHLAEGRTEEAAALAASSLIHTQLYLDFIGAELDAHRGEPERACAALRRILSAPSVGFFTRYHVLGTLERCASGMGDFKSAYQFSTQKIRLLEQFTR